METSDVVEEAYVTACQNPSDINEHVSMLYEYAAQCTHIVECGGTRMGSPTWAFLRALLHNGAAARAAGVVPTLISVDTEWSPQLARALDVSRSLALSHEFRHCKSTAHTDLPPTDLLFIDSWHVYAHMKRELEKHHGRVAKWIIMHDTTVDGVQGESVRMGMNVAQQALESGYSEADICRGVWQAIVEFLDRHRGEWRLACRWVNNNGLTILERVGPSPVPSHA